uniref:PH domain-containing protein n=1 Tax=Onchocerca volvulus TaxID=6282 RepID=A0A8R1Y136_ONCVO
MGRSIHTLAYRVTFCVRRRLNLISAVHNYNERKNKLTREKRAMNEIEMGKNSSSRILIEGTLEKLKRREFPWIFSGKKFSTTWVLRYYVLRHSNIPGLDAFLLEQHEDCMPFSKVRKTLNLRRVLQVNTNISLKIGKQNWILAIHYKAKHGGGLKILYLAAHNEIEMNMWIMKLCYARKLQKQDGMDCQLVSDVQFLVPRETVVDESGNEFSFVASCLNNRSFTNTSLVKSPTSSNNTNNANYVNSVTTHSYIHLKDCSSTHSLGSSSASLCSSIMSSSTTLDHPLSENLSSENSFLIPPPIPPKPSRGSRIQKRDKYILNKSLTPANVHVILNVKETKWNNGTVLPNTVDWTDADRTFLSFYSSLTSPISDSSVPKPLPRRRNFHSIPPEVDRSCKPTGVRYIAINTGQERWPCLTHRGFGHNHLQKTNSRKKEAFAASSRFSSTNPSPQQFLHSIELRNKQISVDQETLYDNESLTTMNGVLDYFDPMIEPLAQSQSFIKSSQRPKICCTTEYAQIDEESTKAVLEANVQQDEMRRYGFSV